MPIDVQTLNKLYSGATTSGGLTPSQQSAQNYINKASVQGGLDSYIKNQQKRYADAASSGDTDLLGRLSADAQRVGYGFNYQPPTDNTMTTGGFVPIGNGSTPNTNTSGTNVGAGTGAPVYNAENDVWVDPTTSHITQYGSSWSAADADGNRTRNAAATGAGNGAPDNTGSSYITQMVNNLMQQFQNQNSVSQQQYQQLKDEAQQQAQETADKQSALFAQQLQQLADSHNQSLLGIQNQVQDARSALDDNYFQKYLNTRQDVANRGMANSGIGNDQDTRLLLSKQQDLASLLRDAAAQHYNVDNTYNTAVQGVQNNEAQNNPSALAAKNFQDLYKSTLDSASNSSTAMADLLGKIIGYYMPTQDTLVKSNVDVTNNTNDNNTKLLVQQMQSMTDEDVAKMSDANKLTIAALPWTLGQTPQEQTQSIIQMTQLMGVDKNGQPTLDALKAQDQADHWIASDANAAAATKATLQLGEDKIKQLTEEADQKATQAADELTQKSNDAVMSQQAKILTNAISAKNDEIVALRNAIADQGDFKQADPSLVQQFRDAVTMSNYLQHTLASLSGILPSTNDQNIQQFGAFNLHPSFDQSNLP